MSLLYLETHVFTELNMTLSHYADLFDNAAESIAESYVSCTDQRDNFYPMITGTHLVMHLVYPMITGTHLVMHLVY